MRTQTFMQSVALSCVGGMVTASLLSLSETAVTLLTLASIITVWVAASHPDEVKK